MTNEAKPLARFKKRPLGVRAANVSLPSPLWGEGARGETRGCAALPNAAQTQLTPPATFSCLVVAQTAALPAPDAIREKVAEVLARPDFQVTPESAESAFDMLAITLRILGWILKPFIWVLEMTEGLPAFLRWSIVVGLSVLLVLLVVHIGFTITRAMRGPVRDKLVAAAAAVTQLDPAHFEGRAEQAALRGEWVDAMRFLFRASLLRLEAREKRRFRVGTTNREHLRRYRGTPLFSPIQALVDLIDRKWYRGEDSSAADFETCRQAHAEICELVRSGGRRVHTA